MELGDDTDTLTVCEAVVAGSEAAVATAQLVLEALYPAHCRSPAKLTSADVDNDLSQLLGAAVEPSASAPEFERLLAQELFGIKPAVAPGAAPGALIN